MKWTATQHGCLKKHHTLNLERRNYRKKIKLCRDCTFGWAGRDKSPFLFLFSEIFRHGLNVTVERDESNKQTQMCTWYSECNIKLHKGDLASAPALLCPIVLRSPFCEDNIFITLSRINHWSLTSQIFSWFKLLWSFEVRKETPIYSYQGPGPGFLNENKHFNYIWKSH